MHAADNLATIRHYFDVVTGKRSDRDLASFFADDVTWQVPQTNPSIRPNPRIGKAGVMDLLTSGVGIYRPGSMTMDLDTLFGDTQQVAARFTLHATLANGRDYHNQYAFIFALRDGLITGVWEFLDTLYQAERGAFDAISPG
ncbi:MAG TPA: nuclear transport factor 2 family protein [Spongiibacteraceae bacterium]|nr:nuclear transport factor 2 family protein [Spongiibacteraceae bacterium]